MNRTRVCSSRGSIRHEGEDEDEGEDVDEDEDADEDADEEEEEEEKETDEDEAKMAESGRKLRGSNGDIQFSALAPALVSKLKRLDFPIRWNLTKL